MLNATRADSPNELNTLTGVLTGGGPRLSIDPIMEPALGVTTEDLFKPKLDKKELNMFVFDVVVDPAPECS